MFDLTTADVALKPEDGLLIGVNIHLDYDDYRPDVMKRSSKNESLFYVVKMVPPRKKIRYYFSLALEKTVVVPLPASAKKSQYTGKF
jgi:hypothetical protein